MNKKILIVDDEKEIVDLLEVYLSNDGYSAYKCYNGLEAMKCIEQSQIDLAILDIMLPDIDGFRLCQKIREKFYFPIIMLTAKIEDSDKIMGLTIGADDYITKPFNPLEVVARVKTQLRRYQSYNSPNLSQSEEKDEYDIRGLLINRVSHKCYLYGKEIALTPLEFSILWYLCEHQGKVVASEELFEAVWKEKYLRNSNNTVMAHIGRLREKLNEPSKAGHLFFGRPGRIMLPKGGIVYGICRSPDSGSGPGSPSERLQPVPGRASGGPQGQLGGGHPLLPPLGRQSQAWQSGGRLR